MATGTSPSNAEQSLREAAPGDVQIGRALLSVSDKTGLVEFASGLAELGIELISTGGTAKALADAGLAVRSISDLTGFPEIMDGRVKTLHPKLYASLLAVRSDQSHVEAAAAQEVEPVDLVCVNLYPFEETAAKPGVSDLEVIENIDIGGPAMIRAAAKNFAFTAPVTSPVSYDAVLEELRHCDRRLSLHTREALAASAFAYTARYDTAIARWFRPREEDFPELIVGAFERSLELSYGENPHQRAAYYAQVGAGHHLLGHVEKLHGKDLSFNNLLDLDSARALLAEFSEPACVIVKHGNPCGVAVAGGGLDAYKKAFACDPMSAFGGVIALNERVDKALAEALDEQFIEVLIAPGYDEDALEVLRSKRNRRLLDEQEPGGLRPQGPALRQVMGGILVQDPDTPAEDRTTMEVASARQPTEAEWDAMLFAWTVCKHVRSNAIVLARDGATIGIGAGQMSRVDSVRLALEKAQSDVAGCALASDAFFPFADGPQAALDAGITAVIQPGGSVRDAEVAEAIDAAGAAMVFTSRRHFRH